MKQVKLANYVEWLMWMSDHYPHAHIAEHKLADSGYTVYLATIEYSKWSRIRHMYLLTAPDDTAIFYGDGLETHAGNSSDSFDTAMLVTGFLTMRPGDTDDDYFDQYTREQMDWCVSPDSDELMLLVDDWEHGKRVLVRKDDQGFFLMHISGEEWRPESDQDVVDLADTLGYTTSTHTHIEFLDKLVEDGEYIEDPGYFE